MSDLYFQVFKDAKTIARLNALSDEGYFNLASFHESLMALTRHREFHIEFTDQFGPDSRIEPFRGLLLAPGILFDSNTHTLLLGKDPASAEMHGTDWAALFRGVHLALFHGILEKARRGQGADRNFTAFGLLINTSAAIAAYQAMNTEAGPSIAARLPPLVSTMYEPFEDIEPMNLLRDFKPSFVTDAGLSRFGRSLHAEWGDWLGLLAQEKSASPAGDEALNRLLNETFSPERLLEKPTPHGAGEETSRYYASLRLLSQTPTGKKIVELEIQMLRHFAGNQLRAAFYKAPQIAYVPAAHAVAGSAHSSGASVVVDFNASRPRKQRFGDTGRGQEESASGPRVVDLDAHRKAQLDHT